MKEKNIISIVVCLMVALFFVNSANADLFNRGTDTLGRQLIYDSDLDITWYDYTRTYDTWQNQVDWSDTLSVTFGGNTYNAWRLPLVFGNCYAKYNCTNSEMGHLYYTELGNIADTDGQPWTGLQNTGDFQNLQANQYWMGTEYGTDAAYNFHVYDGFMYATPQTTVDYAIAVRTGDVPDLSVVPEPISSILFITGGAILGFKRLSKRG